MRVGTYTLTVAGALALSLSVLAQQPPAGPPAPAAPAAPLGPPAPFYPHTVATGLRGGYQVIAVDINKDGKVDLVGLGSQNPELIWYENPYWTPHVMTREAPRMVNMAAADLDRDGIPELALAFEFSLNSGQNPGKIGLLKSGKDPREPWTLRTIDTLPMTSHRVRFATIGNETMLVSAPILTSQARDGFNDPDHTTTPLHVYRAPDWKREVITDESKGVVHGLFINDWNNDGRADVLTTGYQGIFVHELGKDGKWSRTKIGDGNPGEWPQSGTSDMAIGTFAGKRFFAANEPFHGSQVVVYQENGGWSRNVIDTALNNSHSLTLVDSDGDGNMEIVSGGTRGAPGTARGAKPGVFFYKAADAAGQKWDRMVLDATIAANGCVAVDVNADRKMDVACIDAGDPWSLKWYENTRK